VPKGGLRELERLWRASKAKVLTTSEMNDYVKKLEFYYDCYNELPFWAIFIQ